MDPITMKVVAEPHIRRALAEDITSEDVATASVMPEARRAVVDLLAKQDGVIAGLDVFEQVFKILDPSATLERRVQDGQAVVSGQLLGVVSGDARALLSGERTALNYLQRMSGIATQTRKAVWALASAGSSAQIVDTRKTTPGMRVFEKEAVRLGGGGNHRYNLSDCAMLKDNHIAAAGGIRAAVACARKHASFVCKIEVECETLEQVAEALEAGADVIMLDNMDVERMARALEMIDGRAQTECSGNVDLDSLGRIAGLGVDFVSSGALTHSAGILDLSLKNLRIVE